MMNARDEGHQVGKAQVVLIGFSGRAGQGGSAPSKGPMMMAPPNYHLRSKLPARPVSSWSPLSLFIPIRSMGMLVGA